MKKNKYFPNKWKKWKEFDEKNFDRLPFDVFMDWKIGGWQIPDSVVCIIRAKNVITGKVTEHVYKRPHAAKQKCRELMDTGCTEVTIVQRDQVHFLAPMEKDDII